MHIPCMATCSQAWMFGKPLAADARATAVGGASTQVSAFILVPKPLALPSDSTRRRARIILADWGMLSG